MNILKHQEGCRFTYYKADCKYQQSAAKFLIFWLTIILSDLLSVLPHIAEHETPPATMETILKESVLIGTI